jgi:anti-sigma factor RsiW
MTRCTSAEEIGNLAMGNLPQRRAARIASHLAGCPQCQTVSSQLNNVSSLLQSAHFPEMPQHLSTRLQTALAGESASRVSRAPATEAGRRDLPPRADRQRWPGWRPPSISWRVGRRALAAAAAVVVIGGGYAAITHLGQSTSSRASSAAAASGPATLGPKVSNGHQSVDAIKSNTDFVPAKMQAQVETALVSEHEQAVSSSGAPAKVRANANIPYRAPSAQMDGCVKGVAAGQKVLLVEIARYQGKQAWIIVVAANSARPKQVWVVSTSCSATDSHIVARETLPSR